GPGTQGSKHRSLGRAHVRGGSPREGARSELASGAATGGGGRSAPDPDLGGMRSLATALGCIQQPSLPRDSRWERRQCRKASLEVAVRNEDELDRQAVGLENAIALLVQPIQGLVGVANHDHEVNVAVRVRRSPCMEPNT